MPLWSGSHPTVPGRKMPTLCKEIKGVGSKDADLAGLRHRRQNLIL